MAYDSDTRVKEALKDVSRLANLKRLKLRIFDESNEDQYHWTEGGLTFGPKTCIYGSNDAGWFLEEPYYVDGRRISMETPVMAVEGSYGTETGNTGSAQYARFSHALGATVEGFIGVYFIPFESKYVRGIGDSTNAYLRPEMLYAALNASKEEKGQYLFIDAYNPDPLIELLSALDSGNQDIVERVINQIKAEMLAFANKRNSTSRMHYAYNNHRVGKVLMFNVVSFSSYNFRTRTKYRAGRFRNGHTIVGTALIDHYRFGKPFDLILPRFTLDDVKRLDRLHQKEWILLRTHPDVSVVTLDDLKFKDIHLREQLYEFIDTLPLLGESLVLKNRLAEKIMYGFQRNEIGVDWDRIENSLI